MEDRINWSDEQWAVHLGIPVTTLSHTRNSVDDQYLVNVVRSTMNANLFTVALYKRNTMPSGIKTLQLIATAPKEFPESFEARKYANNEFLPSLEMTDDWARMARLPKRALQLLSIRER